MMRHQTKFTQRVQKRSSFSRDEIVGKEEEI